MLGGITNFGSMLKQAGQLSGKLQNLGEELKTKRVTGTAGGGLVEAEANGLGQLLRVKLDPDLVQRNDRELLEDLIPAAVNQALSRAEELHAAAVKELAGGMNLPGLDEALTKFSAGPE